MVIKSLLKLLILFGILLFLTGCNDKIEPWTTGASPPSTVKTAVAAGLRQSEAGLSQAEAMGAGYLPLYRAKGFG